MHIQDLLSLHLLSLVAGYQLYRELERGNFVVQISGSQLSRIYYNQTHEQGNKAIKSIVGTIDFRVSNEFQRRWGDCRTRNCRIFRIS